MQEATSLLAIVAALSIGVVSPGPSFVMVARVAVAMSRRQALGAALGMGLGGAVFGAAALFGLQAIFVAVPALYVGLKVLGGLYLCYLGVVIFRAATQPLMLTTGDADKVGATAKSFWLGLMTQVSNPKTAIIYASVFAGFLPPHFSAFFASALLLAVFLVEAVWYALVALLLSSSRPQRAYLSFKAGIDRAAGLVMLGLGVRCATSAA